MYKVSVSHALTFSDGVRFCASHKLLTNIDVGNIRPENCVQGDGPEVYVGELYFGGVNKANLFTGKVTSVVPSFGYYGRGAAGLLPVDGYLFVAGGGTLLGQEPKFYVYKIATGDQVVACSPPYNVTASLFNDVVVVGRKAYFTDSQYNALIVADVEAAKKGSCDLSYIPLPEAEFFDPNYKKLMANGEFSNPKVGSLRATNSQYALWEYRNRFVWRRSCYLKHKQWGLILCRPYYEQRRADSVAF